MRVISGRQKGRILKAVPGESTRPTTDKVKESIFNIIGPYFQQGYGLDLFAGSGGLGIEGISRGLDKVIFVDRDAKAIKIIKKNIDLCGFQANAEVYKNDWKRALNAIIQRNIHFKVIWLDPPYHSDGYLAILEIISKHELLEKNGVVVCEHRKERELPATVHLLEKNKEEQYGTISISFYHRKDVEEES